ncbi:MAG: hypothetical protein COW84_01210 [Gammaproteobacteria bacterium CG22_combo_CG10-13_8_21_14_all_40_8]|nr:MAG: hypothetical protein COW84_01210 [Gammaproteobacteria bacterium CG22_combo_CG10-13_8_21_14_all_40_8]
MDSGISPRLLLLRSEQDNAEMEILCSERGIKTFSFSALKLLPKKLTQRNIQQLKEAEIIIFCSKPAVTFFQQYLNHIEQKKIFAVGKSTGRFLKGSGLETVQIPQQQDSEGLLALSTLQKVCGKKILVISGENGLDTIQQRLVERGAFVDKLEVYQRQKNQMDNGTLLALKKFKPNCVLITSVEILESCVKAVAGYIDLSKLHIISASKRITQAAKLKTFQCITQSEGASNLVMLRKVLEVYTPPENKNE